MRIPDHIDRNDDQALAEWMASDDFEPDSSEFVDATPLRRVAAADEALARARQHLDDEVRAAHEAGLSWTAIGLVLGISRQAARQRFGTHARA
jgi:hypothetical protein